MTLLLMENEMTKLGFTLLRLIRETTKPYVVLSIESMLNGHYLSCKYWREIHTGIISDREFTHGPCSSGTPFGSPEYDNAYCLKCDFWPANARDCIRRLYQCGWPSYDTVLSIANDGVLFVPIGAKQSIFENTEWRMSFSLAEKKTNSCHESYTVPLLWTFENIPERSNRREPRCQRTALLILPENRSLLGDHHNTKPMEPMFTVASLLELFLPTHTVG